MADIQHRLATILCADVTDSDHASGGIDSVGAATLWSRREIIRREIVRHGGRLVPTDDISAIASFPTIVGALNCAIGLRASLRQRGGKALDDSRLFVRIGISFGDCVTTDDGSIAGRGVMIASRLRNVANPDDILMSSGAYDLIAGKTEHQFEEVVEVEEVVEEAHDGADVPIRAYRLKDTAPRAWSQHAGSGNETPSIAVLPFDNLSGDREDEYFADGMVEDLITALSRIRWLTVIARNTTFTYKGHAVDVKRVARDLTVRYVLEGSVRRGGDRVRISAQLIEGRTGGHLWARHYDRQLSDIFAVQDQLTRAIAGEIEPELGAAERELAVRKPPESLTAWDIYQRGLANMWTLSASGNEEAQRLIKRAIEIDPRFASAYAALAYSLYMDSALAFKERTADDLREARQLAQKAISLDSRDAMAHCALGRIDTALGDHVSAVRELGAAIELNPSFALAHHGRAMCLALLGRADEAIPEFELATRLSPRDPYLYAFQVVQSAAYNVVGDFVRGEECARQAANHPNAQIWAFAHLAQALAGQGRIEEAGEALAQSLKIRPDFSPAFFNRLWPNCSPAFLEPYFELLKKAGLEV